MQKSINRHRKCWWLIVLLSPLPVLAAQLNITGPYTPTSDIILSDTNNGVWADYTLIGVTGTGKFISDPDYQISLTNNFTGQPWYVLGALISATGTDAEFILNGKRGADGRSNIQLHVDSDGPLYGYSVAVYEGARGILNNVDISQSGGMGLYVHGDLTVDHSNLVFDNIFHGLLSIDSQLTINNSYLSATYASESLVLGDAGFSTHITINDSVLTANADLATLVGLTYPNGLTSISVNNSVIENTSATGRGVFFSNENSQFNLSGGQVRANDDAVYVAIYSQGSLHNMALSSTNASAINASMLGAYVYADNISLRSGGASAVTSLGGAQIDIYGADIDAANTAFYVDYYDVFYYNTGGTINAFLQGNRLTNGGQLMNAVMGTVNLSASDMAFSGDIVATPGQGVANVSLDNAYWRGNASYGGAISLVNHGQWTLNADSDVGSLSNGGTVVLAGSTLGNVLTVRDNYHGDNGVLLFNGVLGDDSSVIDKLVINGDSSGHSWVSVNNIGGLGTQTVNGIELITVAGDSAGLFSQNGRIVAGGYDYTLIRSQINPNNWVLMNGGSRMVTPEVGNYLGDLYMANNLFNLRLYDRVGETHYIDRISGQTKVTSMWLRHQYGYNQFNAVSAALAVKNNWHITQLGGDIAQWSSNDTNRFHLGVMAGYSRSNSRATNPVSGYQSRSTVDGYSYGVYGSWFDNQTTKQGLYLDGWMMWQHFDSALSSDAASAHYRLQGLTASLESGYRFTVGEFDAHTVVVEPQGQAIWQGVKAKDSVQDNGTRTSSNHGNLLTRLGVRAMLQPLNTGNSDSTGQVFLAFNWLHNSKQHAVTLNQQTTFSQDSALNIAEIKTGVEGYINKNTDVWFNVAGQFGSNHYRSATIMLGLKYRF